MWYNGPTDDATFIVDRNQPSTYRNDSFDLLKVIYIKIRVANFDGKGMLKL